MQYVGASQVLEWGLASTGVHGGTGLERRHEPKRNGVIMKAPIKLWSGRLDAQLEFVRRARVQPVADSLFVNHSIPSAASLPLKVSQKLHLGHRGMNSGYCYPRCQSF